MEQEKSKFTTITSKIMPLLKENIDTDQIIPARFLKTTSKDDLGRNLFSDWRYGQDGENNPDFILNNPHYKDAQILIAGNNFGCGSSREHAPWALKSYGFKAVISTSFADIFRNNSLKNGLLPIQLSRTDYENLLEMLNEIPFAEFSIDLQNQTILTPVNHAMKFPIDNFYKTCLLNGVDELGYILSFTETIKDYEYSHQKG